MRAARARRSLSWDRILAGAVVAAVGGVVAWGLTIELQSSPVQARLFTKLASGFSYSVDPGKNPDVHFPDGGPYDERLG